MSLEITIGSDYYGWLATFAVDDPTPWVETLNAAQIARLLVGYDDTFNLGRVRVTRAHLVEARDLLEARSEKLADLKAERAMGWQA